MFYVAKSDLSGIIQTKSMAIACFQKLTNWFLPTSQELLIIITATLGIRDGLCKSAVSAFHPYTAKEEENTLKDGYHNNIFLWAYSQKKAHLHQESFKEMLEGSCLAVFFTQMTTGSYHWAYAFYLPSS